VRARRLWHLLLRTPRFWAGLFLWQAAVLVVVLFRHALLPVCSSAVCACETALVISGLLALGLAALIAVHFYATVRDIRTQLFKGEFEEAYEIARRHAGVVLGLDLESALRRLLEFDSRRAEKVAAATRLVGRLLRELPLMMFLGDSDAGETRFSTALCELFGISDNTFSTDALLRQPDNAALAELWKSVASGERSAAEDTLTVQLPARQIARRLRVRLLAVQDDQGAISYILGLAQVADEGHAPEPEPAPEEGASDRDPAASNPA